MDPTPVQPDPKTVPDKHGHVVITVDGHDYLVKPGTTTVANLAKHAQLVPQPPPPTMSHATTLATRTGQHFSAADEVVIHGGEAFTTNSSPVPPASSL
jgi:hypothetical protein